MLKTRHKAQGRIGTRKMAHPKAKASRNAPTPIPALPSKGEAAFAMHCKAYKLTPTSEFRFAPPRKWRVDFMFEEEKLAVEIEGGVWSGGRHTRASGFNGDIEKYNALTKLGYRLLRYSTEMVIAGTAVDDVLEVLGRA